MSSDRDLLERWIAENLKHVKPPDRRDDTNRQANCVATAGNGGNENRVDERDDIERMVDLIEAASAKMNTLDLDQLETVFTGQAAALNVIFGQFVRAAGRKFYVFDSMQVALRAQAQYQRTCKSLIDWTVPPPSGAGRQKRSAKTNSPEQNIENAKTST